MSTDEGSRLLVLKTETKVSGSREKTLIKIQFYFGNL